MAVSASSADRAECCGVSFLSLGCCRLGSLGRSNSRVCLGLEAGHVFPDRGLGPRRRISALHAVLREQLNKLCHIIRDGLHRAGRFSFVVGHFAFCHFAGSPHGGAVLLHQTLPLNDRALLADGNAGKTDAQSRNRNYNLGPHKFLLADWRLAEIIRHRLPVKRDYSIAM